MSAANEPKLTNRDWAQVLADPDSYKGRRVELVGKAFQIERFAEGGAVQMWTTDSFGDGNTIVYTYRTQQVASLRENDFVLVRGEVTGKFAGENAFGAELTAPQVQATSIRAISAATAAVKADPPVASKALRVAGEQAGFRVVVRKVERLRNGGRVTVEAINRSGGKVSIYGNTAKLIQGGRQSEPAWSSDFPTFDTELNNGVRQTAVLVFDELRKGPAKLVISWWPDNWQIDAKDFELPFRVP